MAVQRLRHPAAALLALALSLALGACDSPSTPAAIREAQAGSAVAAVDTGIDLLPANNCRVETGENSANLCGTRKVPLENVPAFSLDRLAVLSFGEEGPAILEAVGARRRVAEQVLNAPPSQFSAALDKAEIELRGQLKSVCAIEARRKRGQDREVTRALFELYAWTTYRRALIDRSGEFLVDRWGKILDGPCFDVVESSRHEEFTSLYFGRHPKFLSMNGKSTYDLPEYFAASLSYYYHIVGNSLLADALWYRADLDRFDDSKVACLTSSNANLASGKAAGAPKMVLWSACTELALSGKSCLAILKACGGPDVPPPW